MKEYVPIIKCTAMKKVDLKNTIRITFSAVIICFCMGFVTWQSTKCINKYVNNPQGTKLSVVYTNQTQFPAITICFDPDIYSSSDVLFNQTRLSECGINSLKDYTKKGKWVGYYSKDENCTDPEALFESIVTKPKDLVYYIYYQYFETNVSSLKSYTKIPSEIWTYTDTQKYGRCFTAKPTEKMIGYGIREIRMRFWKAVVVFFHTAGMFETARQSTYLKIGSNRKFSVDLEHETFEMLDFGGEPCQNDQDYNKDKCTQIHFEKDSMDLYGCTSPFGPNKENICEDMENGTAVMKMYKKIFDEHEGHNCISPCSFLTTRAIKTEDKTQKKVKYNGEYVSNSYMVISLKENIKMTEAHKLYSLLSMIAEIGGYVGLFLGVSVKQITVLMELLFDWIDSRCNDVRSQ